MDLLHLKGIDLIVTTQQLYQEQSELMLFLSHLGDPRNAFLVYFPLAFFLSRDTGVKVVWAGAISEWLNALLKWLMFGERPYWRVHTTPLYTDDTRPHVDQFRLTCETGPGSPSGHAMVTASVWYLIIRSIISRGLKKHTNRVIIAWVLWLTFLIGMILVSVSRCFIAAHFPHQVVFGTAVGIVIGELMLQLPTNSATLPHYGTVVAAILCGAPATSWLVQKLVGDPSWSVQLAQKWCARSEWVYLDTTPYFAVTRDASMILGTGLSLWLLTKLYPQNKTAKQEVPDPQPSLPSGVLMAVVSVVFTRGLEYVRIPQSSLTVFYSLAFCRYLLIPSVVICLIPAAIKVILSTLIEPKVKDR